MEAFVARLRAGEAVFQDEAAQGRTRSLAASLNYGFEHAFNEDERKQLALLHLFQGFVQAEALRRVTDLTGEAVIKLLDRAAEVGLLTSHGSGGYSIHPALPWLFRGPFEKRGMESREHALRAYVNAIASLGEYYSRAYAEGHRDVIGALKAEESNLLRARALAREHGWWLEVIGAMQGLRQLYNHTGRKAEWARLVETIVPEFVDPATEAPLSGRADYWRFVTEYRVRLALEARKWDEAERLQRIWVELERRNAHQEDRNSIRNLAVSLEQLGHVQRETGQAECAEAFRESFYLALRIQDRPRAAFAAFNLGSVYGQLAALRNLDEAERWSLRGLELTPETDRMSRAASLDLLGSIAYVRFTEARAAKKPELELRRHLNEALRWRRDALEMTPRDAVDQLAVIHTQLGNIYGCAHDFDSALHHYRESIRLHDGQGDFYSAAQTRYNVGLALMQAGRFADARQYAEAALRGFQTYGASAAAKVQKTLALIAAIAKDSSS